MPAFADLAPQKTLFTDADFNLPRREISSNPRSISLPVEKKCPFDPENSKRTAVASLEIIQRSQKLYSKTMPNGWRENPLSYRRSFAFDEEEAANLKSSLGAHNASTSRQTGQEAGAVSSENVKTESFSFASSRKMPLNGEHVNRGLSNGSANHFQPTLFGELWKPKGKQPLTRDRSFEQECAVSVSEDEFSTSRPHSTILCKSLQSPSELEKEEKYMRIFAELHQKDENASGKFFGSDLASTSQSAYACESAVDIDLRSRPTSPRQIDNGSQQKNRGFLRIEQFQNALQRLKSVQNKVPEVEIGSLQAKLEKIERKVFDDNRKKCQENISSASTSTQKARLFIDSDDFFKQREKRPNDMFEFRASSIVPATSNSTFLRPDFLERIEKRIFSNHIRQCRETILSPATSDLKAQRLINLDNLCEQEDERINITLDDRNRSLGRSKSGNISKSEETSEDEGCGLDVNSACSQNLIKLKNILSTVLKYTKEVAQNIKAGAKSFAQWCKNKTSPAFFVLGLGFTWLVEAMRLVPCFGPLSPNLSMALPTTRLDYTPLPNIPGTWPRTGPY